MHSRPSSSTTTMPVSQIQVNGHSDHHSSQTQVASATLHTPPSPGPSSSGWKSLLKLGNYSSRKLANGSTLTLDTNIYHSESTSATLTPLTPTHALAPGASQPVDQRSSYNSSLSTDSNSRPSKNSSLRTPSTPSYFSQQPGEGIDTIKEGEEDGKLRGTIKADKLRLGKSRIPQTANASQMSFMPPSPPSASRASPLSPKVLGANATRFIRRVASAPNAKGLFSLGSRSASGTTTKNGLLAAAEVVPTIPQSDSSLDTVSSMSSRGRPTPIRTNSGPAPKTKDRVTSTNSTHDGPGKMPFRRTYSSHSIKVRQVSSIICIYITVCI